MSDRAATPHHTLEHEQVLEAVQKRLDENPQAMRQRRTTVEHPFGTIKAGMCSPTISRAC